MKKLLMLLTLMLSVVSFSSNSYAGKDGAEIKCAEGDKECIQKQKQKQKQKKKKAEDEEPECE